jgi:eukaryotic-like serine/threonine-protein kinase
MVVILERLRRARGGAAEGTALRAGPFRLLRQLDGGGEAQVWLAEHATTRAPAVVKVQSPTSRPERLRREVAVLHVLQTAQTPNVVRLLPLDGTGSVPDEPGVLRTWRGEPRLFCALEALPSGREHNLIRQGPLKREDALAVCDGLRAALRAMHADFKIVHNDLKPDNLVAWRPGRSPQAVRVDGPPVAGRLHVRLLDFGQAAQLVSHPITGQPYLGPSEAHRYVYQSGTWPYCAPERWRREPLDDRSDQWSFAATVFELLTGERLVRAQGKAACENEIVGGAYLAHVRAAKLPEAAREAFQRALAPSMVDRYPAVPPMSGLDAFYRDLEGALA